MTACGPGSTKESTNDLRLFIRECVKNYDIKTVNDAGCGDLFWITIAPPVFDYCGYDDLIRQSAKDRLPPNWKLVKQDIRHIDMRQADLCICKDVLRHHSTADAQIIADRILSTSQYIIADYNDTNMNEGGFHELLNDGDSYLLRGNKTDARLLFGEPIAAIPSTEADKFFGLFDARNTGR